jgi:hypothetical protein
MHFYRLVLGDMHMSILDASLADMVSAIAWIVLTPVALGAGQLIPIRGRHWLARTLLHVLVSFGVSVLHVRLIMATGVLTRPLFSGANFNQLVLNCVIYFILVSITHRRAVTRWFQERQTKERRLEAELAQANWDAMAMEAQPAFIATELERLASRMDESPEEAEEDVLALADMLRQLLSASSDTPASSFVEAVPQFTPIR